MMSQLSHIFPFHWDFSSLQKLRSATIILFRAFVMLWYIIAIELPGEKFGHQWKLFYLKLNKKKQPDDRNRTDITNITIALNTKKIIVFRNLYINVNRSLLLFIFLFYFLDFFQLLTQVFNYVSKPVIGCERNILRGT